MATNPTFSITIKDSGGRLDRLLQRSAGNVQRGLVAAINRTAQAAQTQAVRSIQADTGAKSQKAIRANLYVSKASAKPGNKTEAAVTARSRKKNRIPVYDLGAQPRSPGHRPRSPGVTAGPERKLYRSAFIQRMQSGHVGVFARHKSNRRKRKMLSGRYAGQERHPIKELLGPSVALVFGRTRIKTQIQRVIDERLGVEVDRALKHFMK